jgi:hypothetical protein
MFSASNQSRELITKTRKKINNQIIQKLLISLDDDFNKIMKISPWNPQESDFKPDLHAHHEQNKIDIENWSAGKGKSIMDSLKNNYINPTSWHIVFYEFKSFQKDIQYCN